MSNLSPDTIATLKRIRACFEAMDGIDDPMAARALLDDPRTAAATDLLAALKELRLTAPSLSACVDGEHKERFAAALNRAYDAIAKAETRS